MVAVGLQSLQNYTGFCRVQLVVRHVLCSRQILVCVAHVLECLAGLHRESIEQAEQQLTLVCGLLTGVCVPCILALMQVGLTSVCI